MKMMAIKDPRYIQKDTLLAHDNASVVELQWALTLTLIRFTHSADANGIGYEGSLGACAMGSADANRTLSISTVDVLILNMECDASYVEYY